MTVPATTLVHLDSQGSVVEVWTNTGTAPQPDAETWVQRDGVSGLHPADASLEERVAAIAWTGPWPPGEWHRPPAPAS